MNHQHSNLKCPAFIKNILICCFPPVQIHLDICRVKFWASKYIRIFVRSNLGHPNIFGHQNICSDTCSNKLYWFSLIIANGATPSCSRQTIHFFKENMPNDKCSLNIARTKKLKVKRLFCTHTSIKLIYLCELALFLLWSS